MRSFSLLRSRRKFVALGSHSIAFNLLRLLEPSHSDFAGGVVIKRQHWLDDVLPKYSSKLLGQTPLGLPYPAKRLFYKLYPNFPEGNYITWGMFSSLKEEAITELKKDSRIEVIDSRDSLEIKLEENDTAIAFSGQTLTEGKLVPFYRRFSMEDTSIINWYRCSSEISYEIDLFDGQKAAETINHLLNMYTIPTDRLPKRVLTIGPGLTIFWLASLVRDRASVELHTEFFTKLAETVADLDRPVAMQAFIPMMIEIFKSTQNPTSDEVERLEATFKCLFEDNLRIDSMITHHHKQSFLLN